MANHNEGRSGVLLKLHIFPTAIVLLLTTPQVSVDDQLPVKMGWGKEFVPLEPGKHRMVCSIRIGNLQVANPSTIDFEIPVGQTVKLRWRSPMFLQMRGRWKNLGTD